MTVAVQALPITYTGNGTAAPLPVPFRFLAPDHLVVTRIVAATGARIVLTRGTHYSVSGAGSNSGGTVTPLAAIAVGDKWEIDRATPREQPTAYPVGDDFPAATHELALDRNMLVAQEQDRRASDISTRAPLALPGQIGPDFDVTGLGEGDLLEYRNGRLRRFDAAPFAGKYFGGAAVTGKPVPLTGTGGADAALRGDLASAIGDTLLQTVDGDNLRSTLLNRRRVINVDTFGAVGDCVPAGPGGTTGHDDTAAITAAFNEFRDAWCQYVATGGPSITSTYAIGGPKLTGTPGKRYRIRGKLPPLPPGGHVDFRGCTFVADTDNPVMFWTDRQADGGVVLPEVGGGTFTNYGTVNLLLDLPIIHRNGRAGPFVILDTIQHGNFGPMMFIGETADEAYTVSAALTNGSRFMWLDPDDFAKVDIGHVVHCGVTDWLGNPVPVLCVNKVVKNAGASDRTYGRVTMDRHYTGSTGNIDVVKLPFDMTTMKLQQSTWRGRREFHGGGWSCYHGRNRDEVTPGANPDSETVTLAYGFNDNAYGEHFDDGMQYGVVFGPWSTDFFVPWMSLQKNKLGSHLFVDCIATRFGHLRFENATDMSTALKAIPCIAVGNEAKFVAENVDYQHNGIGRYVGGSHPGGGDAKVRALLMPGGNVPTMPDGTQAFWRRANNFGLLNIANVRGMTGPNSATRQYDQDPAKWVTRDGAPGNPGFGYTGVIWDGFRFIWYSDGSETIFSPTSGFDVALASGPSFFAVPTWQVQGNGDVLVSDGTNPPVKLLSGFRAPGVEDAAPAAGATPTKAEFDQLVAKFNALAATFRPGGTHPLMSNP